MELTMKERRRPKRKILFTRMRRDYVNGKLVIHYLACVKEGTPEKSYQDEILVKISKGQYDRLNEAAANSSFYADRKQASKRGKNGLVPGAGHCWPMRCEALAVHPRQVERMNARNKRHGVNVTYEPKHGLAIIPDEGAYKRLRKLEGVHHNNCYN